MRTSLTRIADLTIFVHMHKLPDTSDILRIKRAARRMKKTGGSMTYMQYLDQASRELFGVRHFHEARSIAARSQKQPSALQFYLRSVQENYLDF